METTYADDREAVYPLQRHLVLTAMDSFWFCLGLLGGGAGWLSGSYAHEADKSDVAREALLKLLRWWPQFIGLTVRFDSDAEDRRRYGDHSPSEQWTSWGSRAFRLCMDLGIEKAELRRLSEMDATSAHDTMLAWAQDPRQGASGGDQQRQ